MAMTATRPQWSAQELATIDRRLIVHPYLPSSTEERVVMVEGYGCRLRDADGREYLDATGGLWLAQIGHGRREGPGDHLGDRLLAALRAGRDAGGEEGPVHSSGMVIVDRVPWYVTDLRVDWRDDDPIVELGRLWQLWQPQAETYVTRALDPASAPGYDVPGDSVADSPHGPA